VSLMYTLHVLLTLNAIVPALSVTVTVPNTQTVGQSLALECSMAAVRGITSRVDFIWRSDDTEVERMEGVSFNSTTNNSVVYIDGYTISQLKTVDDDREYQCEVVINISPPIVTTGSVVLDVIGEWLLHKMHTSFATKDML